MAYSQRSKLVYAVSQWKTKAIARRKQVDALTKRILELTRSRDAWKSTAQAHQMLIDELRAELHQQSHLSRVTKKKRASPTV